MNAIKDNIDKVMFPRDWKILLEPLKNEMGSKDVMEIVEIIINNPQLYNLEKDSNNPRKLLLTSLGLTAMLPCTAYGAYLTTMCISLSNCDYGAIIGIPGTMICGLLTIFASIISYGLFNNVQKLNVARKTSQMYCNMNIQSLKTIVDEHKE
jgi:hypothetical protein